MNPLAQELNDMIASENPRVLNMLSGLGKEMFFPKGILMQSAEAKAKAKKFNATIGMAREEGHAMNLPSVMKHLPGLTPDEALNYAPVTGLPDLRAAWREKILRENPAVVGKPMTTPIVTNGLTHALSIVGDLFCEPGDTLILPDKLWGNYRLTFALRRGADIVAFPFYNEDGGFNVAGFREALNRVCAERGKAIALLNFPNNPTGYAPTRGEAEGIAEALIAAADSGADVVALCDDAYFGLFYEDDVMRESLFGLIAGAHERLLAIKGDAATKEVFVWGLRVGFLSFSIGGAEEGSPVYTALEKKVSGDIRSLISNGSILSQRLVLNALQSPDFPTERDAKRDVMKQRALEVKRVLSDEKFASAWEPYPFNSGYFMCVRLKNIPAETLRTRLLDKYGVGTIATADHDLRVAFSCVEQGQIRELFDIIHAAAVEPGA